MENGCVWMNGWLREYGRGEAAEAGVRKLRGSR